MDYVHTSVLKWSMEYILSLHGCLAAKGLRAPALEEAHHVASRYDMEHINKCYANYGVCT